jgi:hypothetical protein
MLFGWTTHPCDNGADVPTPVFPGSRESSSRSDLAHCSLGARRSIPKRPAH